MQGLSAASWAKGSQVSVPAALAGPVAPAPARPAASNPPEPPPCRATPHQPVTLLATPAPCARHGHGVRAHHQGRPQPGREGAGEATAPGLLRSWPVAVRPPGAGGLGVCCWQRLIGLGTMSAAFSHSCP
jgi:hypothetical protein